MNLRDYMYDNNKKEDIIYDLYAFIQKLVVVII